MKNKYFNKYVFSALRPKQWIKNLSVFSAPIFSFSISNEIWISAIKNIKKNEELSYDYGYSFDKDDYLDHQCKCGSKYCIGYIISSDEWEKFLKHLNKKIKKLKKL